MWGKNSSGVMKRGFYGSSKHSYIINVKWRGPNSIIKNIDYIWLFTLECTYRWNENIYIAEMMDNYSG